MSQISTQSGPLRRSWVFVATLVVLLWRVAALVWPSSIVTISDPIRLPMGLLGILFLTCGFAAWWIRPGRWTAVFFVSALGSAVHWGGSIGPAHEALELTFFFVYLAFTVLGEAGLLHLALIFPSDRILKPSIRVAVYSVAAITGLLVPIAVWLPETVLEPVAGTILIAANVLGLSAGVVFLVSLFRVDAATRSSSRLPLVVASMVAATALAMLGVEGIVLPQSEAWNLLHGLFPLAFAFALVRLRNPA